MPHLRSAASALALSAAIALAACGQQGSTDKVARGKYLVAIMACGDCHTPGALVGKPNMASALSGSEVGFFMPDMGYFYPPNLTPDEATGLGKWSEDEIITAIRTGKRPDGRILAPIMSWPSFGNLTDDDAHAIAAYLKSLTPISNKVIGPFGASEKPSGPYMTVVFPPNESAPQANDAPPMLETTPPAPQPGPQ